jgi:hypothetical protein
MERVSAVAYWTGELVNERSHMGTTVQGRKTEREIRGMKA